MRFDEKLDDNMATSRIQTSEDGRNDVMSYRKPLPTIFLLNSDPAVLRGMAEQILSAGVGRVVESCDGKDAVSLAEIQKPDVIVCDIDLPHLNGFQLCQILKTPEFAAFNHIPVILTSEIYRAVMAEQIARDVGAYAYLRHPCEKAEFMHLIRRALHEGTENDNESAILAHCGTIAIIEEDPGILASLTKILETESWRVFSASTPESAFRLLQNQNTQIVMIDFSRMDFCGRDILAHIRHLRPEQVVIAMTGADAGKSPVNLIKAGVDDYIYEPFEPAELLNTCRRAHRKFRFLRIHEQFQEKIDRLKEIGDYLDHLVQHSGDGIFSCDSLGHVRVWNRGAERMYGYGAAEICGQIVDDFLDPPEQKRKAPDVARILREQGAFSEKEIWRRRKDGTVFPVTATYSPITDLHGTMIGFSVIEHDITMAKRLEEELIKSERMRAITQLAVTTNDRVNTPLGVILGYAQFLQRKNPEMSPEDFDALQTIEKQVQKIKNIMNQLERLSEPVVKEYSIEGIEMLDLASS
jgi:PAS domain S-box-containing protein